MSAVPSHADHGTGVILVKCRWCRCLVACGADEPPSVTPGRTFGTATSGRSSESGGEDRKIIVPTRGVGRSRRTRRRAGRARCRDLGWHAEMPKNPIDDRCRLDERDQPCHGGSDKGQYVDSDPLMRPIVCQLTECGLSDPPARPPRGPPRHRKSSRGQTSKARRMRRNDFPLRVVRRCRVGLITVGQNGNPGLYRQHPAAPA
jgi:hypothetical protein